MSANVSFLSTDLYEQCVAAPDDVTFEFEHVAKNVFWLVVVYCFRRHWLVAASCKTPVILPNLFNRHTIAIRTFLALRPFDQYVGNVVGFNRRALIVEALAVSGEVIEPDTLRCLALLENQRGSADARVGLKDSAGQADDCLQVTLGQE